MKNGTKPTIRRVSTCQICGNSFSGMGHNAAPVKYGVRCCDKCNQEIVLPVRLGNLKLGFDLYGNPPEFKY